MMIRACATPPQQPAFKLPPRLARARRTLESKRLDTFREFHESLKKAGRKEADALSEFFKQTKDLFSEDEDEEETPEVAEEPKEK